MRDSVSRCRWCKAVTKTHSAAYKSNLTIRIRATAIADKLLVDFAIIHKERPKASVISRMVLIGDVKDRQCLLVDDMADTCGTLGKAAQTLLDNGAKSVSALVTHAILSGNAIDTIERSPLHKVVVTNTIPLSEAAQNCTKLVIMDISATLAEAIRRIHNGESLSYLFNNAPS